ncbi:hypothetical protein FHX10_003434 [Rhizobium sp. BK591]|uniref:hypothetical protein n=1 Tax=Rhizobium sp. BK591 TaxID=2586985 RepID=UPI00161A2987|nr:hypothetical protein [Rhizobium sp. BK591]MBB3743935.1 hypothetical protein [Rhizobium sp. BK591]
MSKGIETSELIAQISAANTAMLLALATTLEEAGAMKMEHYAVNIKIMEEFAKKEKRDLAANILSAFANQLQANVSKGKA